MKKITSIAITFLLTTISIFSQNPSWLWARNPIGGQSEECNGIFVDSYGNSFITGFYLSTSLKFGTTILSNAGSRDIFLTKYDASGNVVWAKNFGGLGYEEGLSTCGDANGNLYMAGYFHSYQIAFGAFTLTNAGNGYPDIFVIKLSSTGIPIWANRAGSSRDDESKSVSVDVTGNVYSTGFFFSPSINFNTTTLTNTANNYSDIFLVKYNSTGSVLWAKKAGGTLNDGGNDLTTDASGSIYLTGYFSSPSIIFGTTTLTNTNANKDIFLVKYNSSGNVVWANSIGGSKDDESRSIKLDDNGNIYVAGYFKSPQITIGTTTLINTDNTGNIPDIFVAKYDNNGNFLWAEKILSNGSIIFNSTVDLSGNSYISCFSNNNLYVKKYNTSGSEIWSKSNVGFSGSSYCSGIGLNSAGNVYITGSFYEDTLTFDAINLITTNTEFPSTDIFLAKLDNTTDINHVSLESESFLLYPNPVKIELIIESTPYTKQSIEIFNIVGQCVYSQILDKKSIINVSCLLNGIYLIKLSNGTTTKIMKFIKE